MRERGRKTWKERFENFSSQSPERSSDKKLRFRGWAHSLGEYLYILSKNGLPLRHRTYAITQNDEDLLEWEKSNQ